MVELALEELGFEVDYREKPAWQGFAYRHDLICRFTWDWLDIGLRKPFSKWAGFEIEWDTEGTEYTTGETVENPDQLNLAELVAAWEAKAKELAHVDWRTHA